MSNFFSRSLPVQPVILLADGDTIPVTVGEGEDEALYAEFRGLGASLKGSQASIILFQMPQSLDETLLNFQHSSDGVVWEQCHDVESLDATVDGEGEIFPTGEVTSDDNFGDTIPLLLKNHSGDDYIRVVIVPAGGEFDGEGEYAEATVSLLRLGGVPKDDILPYYGDLTPVVIEEGEGE